MARRRTENITFNLSFLDVMSCGFGAVILIYILIQHLVVSESFERNEGSSQELSQLQAILARQLDLLAERRADLQELTASSEQNEDTLRSLRARIASLLETISAPGTSSEDLTRLQQEVRQLQAQVDDLELQVSSSGGASLRQFIGEGDRQYLTGLKVGGEHILVLLDGSTSMLASEVASVIQLRFLPRAQQQEAAKWVWARRIVDWILANSPSESQIQLMTFNTSVTSLFGDRNWHAVSDERAIDHAATELGRLLPSGGTSLMAAIMSIRDLDPYPDNIYLIVDGLPTQGMTEPKAPTISPEDRLKLFNQALSELPLIAPVNVILLPMEGDVMAAPSYWRIAQVTGGSFISPSSDWP
jgi:hypothetical protein